MIHHSSIHYSQCKSATTSQLSLAFFELIHTLSEGRELTRFSKGLAKFARPGRIKASKLIALLLLTNRALFLDIGNLTIHHVLK